MLKTKSIWLKSCIKEYSVSSLIGTRFLRKIRKGGASFETVFKSAQPANICVIGTGEHGSAHSVLIEMGQKRRFLFNCGEGTVRSLNEFNFKTFRSVMGVGTILITHNSWKNVGGLFGWMTTLHNKNINDGGSERPTINIFGPPYCDRAFNNERLFANKVEARLNWIDIATPYENESVRIRGIPIYPSTRTDGHPEEKQTLSIGEEPPGFTSLAEGHFSDSPRTNQGQGNGVCLAYVLQYTSPGPKYDMKKLRDIDLSYEQAKALKNGHPLVLLDGEVIVEDYFILGTVANHPHLVVDCPSEEYLEPLLANEELAEYHDGGGQTPVVVLHLTPAHIQQTPRYQQWMERFGKLTNHLIVNEACQRVKRKYIERRQVWHNMLHSGIFPRLPEEEQKYCRDEGTGFYCPRKLIVRVPPQLRRLSSINFSRRMCGTAPDATDPDATDPDATSTETRMPAYFQKRCNDLKLFRDQQDSYRRKAIAEAAEKQKKLHVTNVPLDTSEADLRQVFPNATGVELLKGRGSTKFRTWATVTFDTKEAAAAWLGQPLTVKKRRVECCKFQPNEKALREEQYPELVFLGTGATLPTRYRANAAILVHISDDECMLLDCAEDTYGQLCRFYGQAGADDILRKLRLVFISHLHIDHHMGLPGILLRRWRVLASDGATPEPLPVLSTMGLEKWLHTLNDHAKIRLRDTFRLIKTETFGNYQGDLMQEFGLKQLRVVKVLHDQFPFGVIFSLPSGYTIVYSGDTRPCLDLVVSGMNCDLLIHEATHARSEYDFARLNKHCTVGEAIALSRSMRAKFTILTHFSARYVYPELPEKRESCIGYAFDFMKVRPSDFKYLPYFLPAFYILKEMSEEEP